MDQKLKALSAVRLQKAVRSRGGEVSSDTNK